MGVSSSFRFLYMMMSKGGGTLCSSASASLTGYMMMFLMLLLFTFDSFSMLLLYNSCETDANFSFPSVSHVTRSDGVILGSGSSTLFSRRP